MVPVFLKGAFKAAFRVAFEERLLGEANGDFIKVQRAWKLFMLLPRMILFRPPRGGKVTRKQLEERCQAFAREDWMHLVRQSMQAAEQGSVNACRRRRRQRGDDVNRRAARALRLVQLGEASSARQALEGAEVAPGTVDTLNQLRDENRRPPVPRSPVPEDVMNADHPFSLDCEQFLLNLKSSKRGAAAGPSGMTADHLMPLLETERDSAKLFALASNLAKGDVPLEVLSWVRMGRITALRQEDGGVRGITVGDILRRLVARTIAQQISKVAPYQYALSTKVGCECVAHIVQTLTDSDESATVVSVDGIGAFDLISRNAMLEGLMGIDGGDAVLPFVRQFYGHPSAHIWEDDMGNVREIAQGRRPFDASFIQPWATSVP